MNEIVLPLIVFGLVLIEVGLILAINSRYFSFGIPLYRKRTIAQGSPTSLPDATDLSERLSKSVFVPLLFRRFTETDYGFREGMGKGSFFKVSYPPLMRGFLTFDRDSREVVVVGYANLWLCALLIYMGKQFLDPRFPEGSIFFLVFVAVCYAIQVRRFGRVAEVASEEWTRAVNLNAGGA